MMTLRLVRTHKTDDGIIGRLGQWATLEEEDQQNQRNISAIPTGTYRCERTHYHGGGYDTFEVMDVPGRSRILFHIGNTEEDTAGCILLGSRLGTLAVQAEEGRGYWKTKIAVLRSGPAFRAFMAMLDEELEFMLEITDWEES